MRFQKVWKKLRFIMESKGKNAQKIRKNVAVDKTKSAYVIYEWSQRHSSMTPMESDSESENSMVDRRQSATEEMSAQYAQQLAFYRKPIVGQDTVCMFCLTRCHSKNPKILTCLHSACQDCFKV